MIQSAPQEEPKEESIENVVLTRPDFKKSIFIGIPGVKDNQALLKLVSDEFPKHHIHVMDKEIFNQNVEIFIKKVVNWQEQQSLSEFCNKTENIQNALAVSVKIKEAVGEGWFGAKEFVEATNFTYPQAKSLFDVQYAFGFLATKKEGGRDLYKSIVGAGEQIAFVESVIMGLENELETLRGMHNQMKANAGVTSSGVDGNVESADKVQV